MWTLTQPGNWPWTVVAVMVMIGCDGVRAAESGCAAAATSQQELNQSAGSTLQAADYELNRVYRAILTKYQGNEAFLEKLRAAQRAWLSYRDADLEAKFPAENKQSQYGSVYPSCADSFLARLTQDRTSRLRIWLDGTVEGDVCAGSVAYEPAP